LVLRYDPGAGIGWHRDRPVFEHVLGISLSAAAVIQFRRRRPGGFDRMSALLPPRSIYHLTGEGAASVGTQHRRDGDAALVDHLPQPVGEGNSARELAFLRANGGKFIQALGQPVQLPIPRQRRRLAPSRYLVVQRGKRGCCVHCSDPPVEQTRQPAAGTGHL
jgi:hypothetical protein